MQIADNITSHFYDLQFVAQSQHAKWNKMLSYRRETALQGAL